MIELLNHLKHDQYPKYFPDGMLTNATRFLYTALLSSVVDDADTIIVTSNGFAWYKMGTQIGTYLGGGTPIPTPSFIVIIDQVLEHDPLVGTYLHVKSTDADRAILTIGS